MASEIVLLPVDAPTPEDVPETPSAAPETPDDMITAKRGRGRPPGAKNKPKTTPIEPVETKRKKRPPTPPQEESEEEEPPTPPPVVKRRAKKRPAPPPSESEEEEREPSPREMRRQIHADVLTRRRNHHQGRVQSYSTLLDHMLAY